MFLHSLGRLLHSSVCIRGTVVRSNTAGRSAEEQIREVFQLVFHSKYKTNNYDNNQQYKRSIQITPAHHLKHLRSPPSAGFAASGPWNVAEGCCGFMSIHASFSDFSATSSPAFCRPKTIPISKFRHTPVHRSFPWLWLGQQLQPARPLVDQCA